MKLLCAFMGSPWPGSWAALVSLFLLCPHGALWSLGSLFHWHPGLCWKTKVLITWLGDKGGLLIFPRKTAVKRCLIYGVSRLPQFWKCSEHKSVPGKNKYEYKGYESWELDCLTSGEILWTVIGKECLCTGWGCWHTPVPGGPGAEG